MGVTVTDKGDQLEPIDTLRIERRFRGPPNSGNGGYSCGRLVSYVPGPATVRLMQPPPLDVDLDVVRIGQEYQLRNGDDVIARAWGAGHRVDIPPAPDLQSARQRRNSYAGLKRHVFPGCFVCGVDRREGDGLRIHAGPDKATGDPRHHVACTWTPDSDLCGEDGTLPAHFVWAALDCPSGWAFLSFGDEIAVLGELSAEVLEPVHCGREYIVAGWEISHEGRKHLTASALYDANGRAVASAQATWITIPPPEQ